MDYKRQINLILGFMLICFYSMHAQYNNMIPPSPQAASIGKFGEIPINVSTGTLNHTIPLFSLTEGDITLPITLQYNYNGFRPSEEPGWAGLGWSLIAGGVITRIVQGVKDEYLNRGYLYKGSQIKDFVDVPNLTKIAALNIESGYNDSQPDIFHFSFPGYSGKFVFDQNGIPRVVSNEKIKIEKGPYINNLVHNDSDQSISSFTITTDDGTKYIFSNYEFTRNDMFSDPRWAVTAWHLSEIVNLKGNSIKFYYTTINSAKPRLHFGISDTRSSDVRVGSLSYNANFLSGSNSSINYSEEIFLSKIETTNWVLEFNSSERIKTTNILNSYSRRLDDIQLYDKSTTPRKLFKKYVFSYNTDINLRLALTSVQEYFSETDKANPYTFTYNPLPPDLNGDSRLIDKWGYYNGQPNTSLIPENVGLADMEPRFEFCRMGTLSQITYPTKGYTSIEYEPNEFSYYQSTIADVKKIVEETRTFWWDVTSSGTYKSTNTPVIVSTPTKCKIKLKAQGNSNAVCFSYNNVNLDTYKEIILQPGTYNDTYFLNLGIFYPCNETLNTIGTSIIISLSIFKETTSNVGTGGGVRVKSITDFPDATSSNQSIVRQFAYKDFENPNLSSGMLGPKGFYNLSMTAGNTSFELARSQTFNTMSSSPLFYYNVEETKGTQSKRYVFTSYKHKTDNLGQTAMLYHISKGDNNNNNNVFSSILEYSSNKELGPYESNDFLRGLLATTSYKNNTTGSISFSKNTGYDMGVPLYQIPSIHVEYLFTYTVHNNITATDIPYNVHYVKTYYTLTGWPKIVIEKTIDNGSN